MDWKARIPALVFWLALVFSSIEDGNAEHRIVCYYTNWSVYRPGTAKFSPQNINPYLCTHLIYAFGGFTKDNTLKPFDKYQDIEKGGYAKFTGLKTYNKNLKTMLAIGGWNEGSSRFSPMVADPGRRKEFVKNSVKFLRQNHFDGLDLDWEYPAFRDGGKPRDRNNYADLVQELREEFERESSKTGRPRLLLSMAVPAGIEYIDKGYDIPRLNDYLDFINLLSYDYHSAYEPAVNHHSPLYPLEEDNEYNYDTELTIDYTIQHLLKSGASSEKIVLGIPTYGRSYTLINEDATDLGSPADGPGEEGDATREKGYLAYYEICESIAKSEDWEVVQPNPNAMGPYAFKEKQWVGYDDEDIVRAKARYVNEKKLGGIMFWSIDNDDFRGKCHGRPYPLIEAAKEAMLAGNERVSTRQKTKLSDNRKKTRIQGGQRIQGNTIGRKLSAGNRRTTTIQAPTPRRRVNSSRSNARSNARSNVRGNNNAEEDEEEDDEEEANAVKAVEKPRTRIRSKSRSKNRVSSGGRRKQQQNTRQTEEIDSSNEESLSNSFTTPEPPTTPDPGSDFKCEDEGFFSHPRDCKKYFWCLDSGPGGLGVVAHQFTCPSGLVFNKAADSCDYPRNVVCPKKTSQSAVTTTKAPTTSVTSRTHLHKPPKRTTTPKPEVEEEEYEYYDDEEVEDSEESVEEPSTTTSKPLQYKTINRSRPTTTSAPTTTTTEAAIAASTRSYKTTTDKLASFEDEEDPRVLKELIDLIKKAGGIEQLEKQLHYQEKNSGGSGDKNESNGKSTPATISRSLYERVLSRQATRIAGSFGSLSTTQSTNGDEAEQKGTKNWRSGFVNGPGGAQFEGLDNVPEVKSLRRTNKPKYVTIERHRPSTSESPAEKDEEDEEDADGDNTDVASSEDRAVSNPPQQKNTNRRVTPSYVNIRRARPSTTTSENDVEVKDEDSIPEEPEEEEEEEPVTQRHRIVKPEVESTGAKSRYTNVNRFRSTTSRNNEIDQLDDVSEKNEITTESTTTTTTTTTTEKVIPVTEEIPETLSTTTLEPSTTESFSASTLEQSSTSVEPSTESSTVPLTTDSSLKLVEESATEILFTTVPASSSSPGSSTEPFTRGPSIAAVSQPRPFGFPRRGRPTAATPSSTSSVASVTEQSRPKVDSETLRLPTLKELVGYSTVVTDSIVDLTSTLAPSTKTFVNRTIDNNALRNEQIDRTVSKNRLQNLIQDLLDEDNVADDSKAREMSSSKDKEIFDNDVLESEEIQQRSYSSSFAASTKDVVENNDTDQSFKRVEVPVKILDDTDGEEIAQLVLLRLPESKLNSPVFKPVFRVKILEQNQHTDVKRNYIESSSVSSENSSENELSDIRRRPSRRRRVRVNPAQASPTYGTPSDESDGKIGERSRPRNRQRIVTARKRTRVTEVPLDRSGGEIFDNRENERSVRVQGEEEISGNRNSVDNKLENLTPAYPAETATTIRATTTRGKLPTSSKPSNVIHGFYITRSSDEIVAPIIDATTTDPSIDSTKYPLTTSDVLDESTRSIDFATQSQETSITQVDKINLTTEENSTFESTTFGEVETTVSVANEIDSLENLLRTTLDKSETVTSDYLSTTDERIAELFTTTIMTTIEKEEEIEEPSITTFSPFTTNELTSNPTIFIDSTPEYSTGTTEEIDKYAVTNAEKSTDYVAETLKTPENKHYRYSTTVDINSSTMPMTTEENNMSITTQTEIPMSRTTYLVEKTKPHTIPSKRGRVRFTAVSKATGSAATSASDHPRKTTNISESDDSRINSISGREVKRTNSTSTKTYDEKVESTTSGDIGSRAYTSRLSPGSHNRQRNTIKSNRANNSKSDSVAPKKVTSQSGPKVKTSASATEANFFTTNFVETTSRLSSRELERGKETTQFFEVDDININSVTPIGFASKIGNSTEDYRQTIEPIIATTESGDLTTNFIKTTEIPYTSKVLEADDVRVNSVTQMDFTLINDITTAVYDKTVEPVITGTESIELSTNFVETKTTSTLSSEIDDSQKTSTSFEIDDTTIHLTTLPASTTDNNLENMTMTGKAEDTTESNSSRSKSFNAYDSTSGSTTPIEIIPTNATIPESYDTTMNDSITAENSSESNLLEITGKSVTMSLTEAGTTEIYGKSTESLEVVSTLDSVTTQEKTNAVDPTNSDETIAPLETTTIPWAYNRQRNFTRIADDNQTQTVNTLSEVTLTSRAATAMETYASTTEVYITIDTLSTVESGKSDVQINKEKEIFTEAVQEMGELMTTLEMKMETTEQSVSMTTTMTPADTTVKNIETTTIPAAKTTSPKNNNDLNALRTTIQNDHRSTYFTEASKYNSFTPSIPRETKRTRGRIRFTNFAGHNDEVGRNRRPVKQVVVRRRLANSLNNRQQIDVSTEETVNTDRPEIEEKENTQKVVNEQLSEERRNSTKWTRRRVVKIDNSAENVNVEQPENEKSLSNIQLVEGKENSTKLINRRVVQIVHSTEEKRNFEQPEIDDRENAKKISDESSDEEVKKSTKWMRRRVVKISNSSEGKTNFDRPEIKDRENTEKVVNESLDEKKKNSTKWARRRVVKISNSSEDKVNFKRPEIEERDNAKKLVDKELPEEKRNSTKSMKRRVVVYRGRPRAESVSTTTMQSSSVSSDEVSEDIGRTRKRMWRKRRVLKRAKIDDLDDQNIEETGHIHRAVIGEDLGALGSHIIEPVVHQLVNSAEREDDVIGDGEVNIYKSSGSFVRRPGTLIKPEGVNRLRLSSGTLLATTQATGVPAPFSKIRPAEEIKTEDQSGRAQELAVTLADPPEIHATSTTGRLPFRKTTRKISTTIAPRTEAPTTSRTTPVSRRRQRPRGSIDKIVETVSTRPRRPAIIDYDYYVDDEVRLVLKPELKDKLFVTRKGGIRCLDQGNFAHPTSCKKFITCARMVNGQVLGTEYTCPDKLSFDPVGGICNWSAGLGCEDKSNT